MKAGEELGPYTLIEELGRGGFAKVWRARLEPERARNLPPQQLKPVLRALAGLLQRTAPQRSLLLKNMLENLELLSTTQESRGNLGDVPGAVLDAQTALLNQVLGWLGEDDAEDSPLELALKVPFHDGYVRQLRREKDVLKRVTHPNLVQQYAIDAVHEPPYLAMEVVEGWSLRDALKTETLPHMKKIMAVMDQLLTVLDHLHRRGLVHGDVKPENIIMQKNGTLRLIDLGLGQVSQAVMRDVYLSLSLASRVPIQGTLSYMAPEVRQGKPPTQASDLYSVGILLYELLVGDVPTGMALPSEAAAERQLTQRFDVLLKWMLHPDPSKRIQTAADFRERVLITLRPRQRHQVGTGRRRTGKAPEGTQAFDQWALEQASPFVQGDWLRNFQLVDPVGRGGFGEVWRADLVPEDEVDQGFTLGESAPRKEVALKIAIGPHGKDALIKEAEIAGLLDHPLIPSVLERHLEHDPPFLVVEFVSGVSLRQHLNEVGPLDGDTCVPLIKSLVDTVAHCHERGVLHQDLKPENLLYDEREERLFLLDFGLASAPGLSEAPERVEASGDLVSKGQEGGTFEYMAPERRRGGASTAAADVYSIGVILYELLTFELPRGLTRLGELAPGSSRSLQALTERLLAPEASARPSLEEVAAKLAQEKPRPRLFTRRRRGAAEPATRSSLVIIASLAALPVLVGAILLASGYAFSGGAFALFGTLTASLALAWRELREEMPPEGRAMWLMLPLAGLAVAALGLIPRNDVRPAVLDRAQTVIEQVEAADPGDELAHLRKLSREFSGEAHALELLGSKLEGDDRAELDTVRERIQRHMQRLNGWLAAREEASGKAARALNGPDRAHLLQQLQHGGPAPKARMEQEVRAWAIWHAQAKSSFESVRALLIEALTLDPLNPDAPYWRVELARHEARQLAWYRSTLAAARKSLLAWTSHRRDRPSLLLEAERLFPQSQEVDALYELFDDKPVTTAEGQARVQLGQELIANGDLDGARAVQRRLAKAPPRFAQPLEAALNQAVARHEQGRSLLEAAGQRVASYRKAVEQVENAASLLPHDQELQASVKRMRQRLDAPDDMVATEWVLWGRERLWSDPAPKPEFLLWTRAVENSMEARLAGTVKTSAEPQNVGEVRRMHVLTLLLEGRLADVQALDVWPVLDWQGILQKHAAHHQRHFEAWRATKERTAMAAAEVVTRPDDPHAMTNLEKLSSEQRQARLKVEQSADQLRTAFLGRW